MRFRPLLLLLPVLLAACAKTETPVRLDFIGTTGLTSGNRTVQPSDTLTTRAYAQSRDNDLQRLRITVKYEPTRNPIIYPSPISSYDPSKTPNDDALVYLDSVLRVASPPTATFSGRELLLPNQFVARATSGTEQWQYTATDANGQSTSRALRLTVRSSDSARVYHSYTALLRPVVPATPAAAAPVRDRARVFLNLRTGLLLPKYALINNENSLQANQLLIDLICLIRNNTVSLHAPASTQDLSLSASTWPVANRRLTRLRRTGLSTTDFGNANTNALLATAFGNGTRFTDSLSTGTLTKGQVIAFRTIEDKTERTGLLLVSDLVLGTAPTLTCTVRVQK